MRKAFNAKGEVSFVYRVRGEVRTDRDAEARRTGNGELHDRKLGVGKLEERFDQAVLLCLVGGEALVEDGRMWLSDIYIIIRISDWEQLLRSKSRWTGLRRRMFHGRSYGDGRHCREEKRSKRREMGRKEERKRSG